MRDYWHKQTAEQPLYPDLLWSRPEHQAQAGKLLIVGGNVHGFAAAAEAYAAAQQAGVGVARVVLPDSLQKIIGKVFVAGEYAPSTPSGSFSQRALAELLSLGAWADGTLVAGDLGRNSETAIVLEKFANDYQGQLTLSKDAVDYFNHAPGILDRPDTTLVLSFAQLQKLAISAHFGQALRFDMDFLRLIDILHDFTEQHPAAAIITKHLETIYVTLGGQVSTTKLTQDKETWRVTTAARAAVWGLQNPGRAFPALSSSLL